MDKPGNMSSKVRHRRTNPARSYRRAVSRELGLVGEMGQEVVGHLVVVLGGI